MTPPESEWPAASDAELDQAQLMSRIAAVWQHAVTTAPATLPGSAADSEQCKRIAVTVLTHCVPPSTVMPTPMRNPQIRPDPVRVHATIAAAELSMHVEDAAAATEAVHAGEFALIEPLGAGGMGEVWRARQASLERDVALKRATGDQPRAAFINEALITAQLDHPNIIPVYSLGQDPQGQLTLALKLVQGISWHDVLHPRSPEQRVRSQRTSREDHLRILIAVSNAIAFAHSKHIIHRDLKPANVIVGAFGEVWVCDWGLAATVDQDGHVADHLPVGGSPAYISPEAALAQWPLVSTRSDVFQLGTMLYEILSGNPPHQADSMAQALWLAAAGQIQPLAPDVPAELADICWQALNREVSKRQASALEFRSQVEIYLEHRESFRMAGAGATALAAAQRQVGVAGYPGFVTAVNHYTQAVMLWEGNRAARDGLRDARISYAQAAMAVGDFHLALTQTQNNDDPLAQRLHDQARRQAATAAVRAKSLRRVQVIAVMVVAALLVGLTVTSYASAGSERRARLAEEAKYRVEAESVARARRRAEAFVPYAEAADYVARGQRPLMAAELARSALRLDPNFIEAAHALGEALRQGGDPEAAVEQYLIADRLSREKINRPALISLIAAGICADGSGDQAHADRIFTQVVDDAGPSPMVHVAATFHALYWEQIPIGLAASERAVLAADLWECRYARGYALMVGAQRGYCDPAIAESQALHELRMARELNPRQADVLIALATLLLCMDADGNRGEILALFDRAIELEPRNGNRWLQRAHSGMTNLDQRHRDLAEALRLGVANTLIMRFELLSAARALSSTSASKTAAALYDRYENDLPPWPSLTAARVFSRLDLLGLTEAATTAARVWIAAHPDLPQAALLRARLATTVDERIAHLYALIERVPWHVPTLNALVELHGARAQNDVALAFVNRLIAIRPQQPEGWERAAELFRALGRSDEAQRAQRKALDLRARISALRAFPSRLP